MHLKPKPLLLSLILILFACKSTEDQLDSIIRKYLEDMAFKDSKELKIFELKTVRYKTLSQQNLDSVRSNTLKGKASTFLRLFDEQIRGARLNSSEAQRTLSIDKDVAKNYLKLSNRATAEAQKYLDSANHYRDEDSLLTLKMKTSSGNSKSYYSTVTFIKASAGKENILDTLQFILTDDYKVIRP